MSDETFIKGRLVSLRRPDLDKDVLQGNWHSWFNDARITEFLEHGAFPITRQEEADILASAMRQSSNLILAVVDNADGSVVGTVSLKGINHIQRRAEIAIVMGFKNPPGAALEAMALMTRHAFDRLSLQKLYAGQHESLWKWVNTLGTIGYRVEGYRENYGFRNGQPYGALLTGITSEQFYNLQASRNGDVLGGDALATAKKRSSKNPVPVLKEMFQSLSGGNS
ncbi:GNAT family N-acetyltransferase [Noviherbaspirillum aridicola]|uniref:N-acetyltransferase domain-containing protein n=1 Tax=Noviherbaspirillum aridicola TaxID=2849687 RepID=A0ABQ4Q287_9BURK|nr:GNAT family protein [Noviherbaspirillum aridicola]GIZ51297.1 hypothetical protein NCCP691_13110 [Noviherbaspirillum aridicola]